jgi:hypothetical protein
MKTGFPVVLLLVSMLAVSCSSDCVTCTGAETPDIVKCKSDYQNRKDFNAYIQEYRRLGGTCE